MSSALILARYLDVTGARIEKSKGAVAIHIMTEIMCTHPIKNQSDIIGGYELSALMSLIVTTEPVEQPPSVSTITP